MYIYAYGYIYMREGNDFMERLTNFFKLLSDETRLRILILLFHKRLCVCELCGIMEEAQPKISKHLAKLRDLGLVKDDRQEQFIFYSLNLNNQLYKNILQNIVENIAEYSLSERDLQRSIDAEKYLEKCTPQPS